ncbi:iron permease FTR1 [Coniophora puteana RWD-64-598 SS2]|uniref:Iron permease FTR1 n=1 Tax=Coniophora puteana (strain RWD-64-598) TaxID=741705 RepID=A0A5M3MDD6_CONPW|nr:iron permease FTR1 [Coniophora puteana RWD-64-598 SS2]EIW77037.1 iron permease FTR1 [Coniophora puteana RWD-64-598 SS2]
MGAQNLFSVSIFIVVFRETLEAAVIVSVLLGLVEQIVNEEPDRLAGLRDEPQRPAITHNVTVGGDDNDESASPENSSSVPAAEDELISKKRLIRKLRVQIFFGTMVGLLVAIAIGAAFIAVWFTEAADLWTKSENLWEGIFELIASLMIFVMGITMLKMDRAKAKWRVKLQRSFSGENVDGRTKTGKWVLFILPMITVLREGIEAVVFVGGVSLGQPATSIPIAAIVGLICGLISGFLIYQFASRTTLRMFLIIMTSFILLIGAGLFSKAVWSFQENAFNTLLGADVDDSGGNGPGSYDVRGNVWHLDCCNPETSQGYSIFNAILGWQNSATQGSVLSYVFYWLAVIAALVRLKFIEGRTKIFWFESAAGKRRRRANEERERASSESTDEKSLPK